MSDTDDDSDPLDGAAIGETRTVRESKTLHGINFEPLVYAGSDRQGMAEIVDVEIVKDDRDGYCDDIRVTWEGDITKTLPPRWDQCNEPRTEKEHKTAKRKKWIGRVITAVAAILPVAIAVAITIPVTERVFDGSLTINGEPMTMPSVWEILPMLGLILLLVGIIFWGVRGGLPRPGPGGRRV